MAGSGRGGRQVGDESQRCSQQSLGLRSKHNYILLSKMLAVSNGRWL